jgi:DNA ligase-1
MLLAELVATSSVVAATRSRLAKIDAIATALRAAEPGEVSLAVRYLSGQLRQRRTGVGWASLRELPEPAAEPTLQVAEVDAAFAEAEGLAGAGSVARRRALLADLFGRATADEQRFLVMLVGGELRQGASAGIVTDAVARAAEIDGARVRRAAMLAGDLATIAAVALLEGADGLDRFGLDVGRPVQPMLAQSAPTVEAAMAKTGAAVVEWKIDGVRVQVHRSGNDVSVYTRTLDRITERVPAVVEAVRALPVGSIVLDGEAIALGDDGRPRLFQETASRAATRGEDTGVGGDTQLRPFFFDVLHIDGTDLIDRGGEERFAAVAGIVPAELWVPRLVTDDVDAATAFYEDAVARGQEGVVVKALGSTYEAGRRGAGWIKVKPRHTLDLVVLAAEWGHGRRQGWLSNLHLGARDPSTGGFVMLGKTFKGLTDALLEWQTKELLARETGREGITVHVRPELVVEIAFDGIQRSTRYPGGMALRFARVLRYRDDKTADEADTLDTLRTLHQS